MDATPEERQELIDLLETGRFHVSRTALQDAANLGYTTEWELAYFILDRLQAGHAVSRETMDQGGAHDGETAYVLYIVDGVDLYIKVLPDVERDYEELFIISFHQQNRA